MYVVCVIAFESAFLLSANIWIPYPLIPDKIAPPNLDLVELQYIIDQSPCNFVFVWLADKQANIQSPAFAVIVMARIINPKITCYRKMLVHKLPQSAL